MVVQHNMQAMNANRTLNITTNAQGKSTEKLSSGYKINRAADDAAGLSISEKMRRQIRGLDRASTNAQDGISSVQTAEGAMNEIHDMLQRMNELANQASNGTNSASDRQSIQDEISQLNTEIDRVAETTKFNETYLLKGDAGTKEINLKAHDAGLKGTLSDQGAKATFEIDLETDTDISISSHNYHIYEDGDQIDKLQSRVDDADKIMINGTTYTKLVKETGVDANADHSSSIAGLKTSAAALQTKAASIQTEGAKSSSAAAIKRGSAASKTGSSAKYQASADKKIACGKSYASKATSLSAKAACLEGVAASIEASAASFNAKAASATNAACAIGRTVAQLEADNTDGTHSSSIAALKTSAAALQTKAASMETEGAKSSSAAALKKESAASKTGSSAKYQASADKKIACGKSYASKATSLSAKAACLEGVAASIEASAADFNAKAASALEAADVLDQTVKNIIKASAGVADPENIKFIADGKEYLASEVKARIVDGAKVGINDEKSRTAVDEINNKNNRMLEDRVDTDGTTLKGVKNMVQDALLQANQIGVDDETAVGVSKASDPVGKTYTYEITKGTVEVAKEKSFELHVGADADLTNKIAVNIETMNSKYLGVQDLNVVDDTGVAATYAIDAIEDALTKVSAQRSELGAVQNRLEHTITNLDNVVENTQSAESEIRDTDIADEMVRYSKNNILTQAGQSMLAQANQSTQGALSLLG